MLLALWILVGAAGWFRVVTYFGFGFATGAVIDVLMFPVAMLAGPFALLMAMGFCGVRRLRWNN